MSNKLHATALLILVVFGAYALSPTYAVLPGLSNAAGPAGASCGGIEVGILWVDLVLDALTGGGGRSECSGEDRYLHASSDDDMILMKKKRAMEKKLFLLQPPVRTGIIAAGLTEHPLPAAFAYDIPRDLIHTRSPDYYSFKTGVSPPLPFS